MIYPFLRSIRAGVCRSRGKRERTNRKAGSSQERKRPACMLKSIVVKSIRGGNPVLWYRERGHVGLERTAKSVVWRLHRSGPEQARGVGGRRYPLSKRTTSLREPLNILSWRADS